MVLSWLLDAQKAMIDGASVHDIGDLIGQGETLLVSLRSQQGTPPDAEIDGNLTHNPQESRKELSCGKKRHTEMSTTLLLKKKRRHHGIKMFNRHKDSSKKKRKLSTSFGTSRRRRAMTRHS
uniref:Uncharacterized protein n=1 Tax=Octactis speculum TaxID=3111310 RepID=A0A7S2MBJ8_9STRA|mmetsp:Transcript_59017/g.80599  ORF Transcript_59017/g.80599 Transcript_59017/m.80599 type:complete len:122 (+) Transcript_59017:39-404(+)|eukprot:CAMPEP_0185757050 /NCGR_PEP_ID=MMETSP1174-20130828/15476_1 /TAXON_ID=35687 /ORGANISM="Dictyocha speculum, Strain CCMP1381" /LENGTH=121 /DNA_ID=CAMNT_0028436295 /DNA_START=39 /DNA_END=404 /DNA_ORIENTATION=-